VLDQVQCNRLLERRFRQVVDEAAPTMRALHRDRV
jgi:hypothetical protein